MYKENDLVRIAKRENNNKRKYLVVNALQGKHIPVSPQKAFDMFKALADIVKDSYKDEKLLLIGFAETATAIGSALAVELNSYYMQTTREIIDNVDYLFFTEAHSHATEQKLVKNDLDVVLDEVQRVVFVEDEVTTGNTILNIINIMEKIYGDKVKFSVASLLNGMDADSLKRYEQRCINVHYLVKTNHSEYTEIAEKFSGNGEYYSCNLEMPKVNVKTYDIKGALNARRCIQGSDYLNACDTLWNEINKNIQITKNQNILVIGTEEFMYPALYIAKKAEEKSCVVKSHSTTRSPIEVSLEDDYPLNKRFELASLYDEERKTFIYDIQKYDKVLIITDSKKIGKKGFNSLINAVCESGNDDINLIRWC